MKHLIISDYGTFLGIDSERLVVKHQEEKKYFPLNRLATISIAKRGVSLSSDLIESLSYRGIKLFFLDFRGVAHSALMGSSQHGVIAVRIAQIQFKDNLGLAKRIIMGKIKNQRATINYFGKYHRDPYLINASKSLLEATEKIGDIEDKEKLMGIEGIAANIYFNSLMNANLFSKTFKMREGRGSTEINNSLLNLGYAVLSSYVLSAVINAGLEPYYGFLHSQRPGKMALVFDLMEEYRAWVVDRNVIKFRSKVEGRTSIDEKLKKQYILQIQKTLSSKYPYRKKKMKLEHIIQRQVYRLCGHFYGERNYKPYLFKW